ncbi:DUF805 domain-containing protein [Caenibius tardaugens]
MWKRGRHMPPFLLLSSEIYDPLRFSVVSLRKGGTIMEWMLLPLKRYADFSGRSRRKEYWMFVLGVFIAAIVLSIIEGIVGLSGMVGGVYGPLTTLFLLGILVPSIAVQVRRFHDQDKSGWFVLLALIPFLGGLAVLVFMCLEGTRGPNRFGPDPKGGANPEVFA